MIEIDGSMGEGGGSVLRMAMALSAVSQRPIHIYNIRARREKPGLQPQHLSGVEALAKITGARLEGAKLHSTELKFEPGPIEGGKYSVDIGTAGSTTLVLQVLMPAAAFARKTVELEIMGGTNNPLAPPIDFLENVTLPTLRKMGFVGDVKCIRRGHYPAGGGIVRARIEPIQKLSAIKLTKPGKITRILGIAHAVRLPERIATRIAHSAAAELIKLAGARVDIRSESYPPDKDPHLGPGAGITLWAETDSGAIIGASSLGRPGKPSELVGREAAEELIKQLKTGAAVDLYMADQLIPYMVLADGTSEITTTSLTSHTLTNVELAKKIFDVNIEVKGDLGKPGKIAVEGVGFKRAAR